MKKDVLYHTQEDRSSTLNIPIECNEVPEDEKSILVNANSAAIMFPYVRAFISTVSINLGNVTGGILIPSQFFQGEMEVNEENTSDEIKKNSQK